MRQSPSLPPVRRLINLPVLAEQLPRASVRKRAQYRPFNRPLSGNRPSATFFVQTDEPRRKAKWTSA